MNKIKVFLLNPLVDYGKDHAHFNRDWCGGELPASFVFPPLDLAITSAYLRKNNIDTLLLDASALHINDQELFRIIEEYKPDYIGIASAWGSFNHDLKLAGLFKEKFKYAKLMISGPNITLFAKDILDYKLFDFLILGELEKPYLDIIKSDYKYNIAYWKNGAKYICPRKLEENLDSLPFADRDSLPNNKYKVPFLPKNPFTLLMSSRGCPYQCNFCQKSIWYLDKVRYRSVENVIEEIKEIVCKYKIPQIIFRDLTFTFNKKRVYEICNAIIAEKIKVNWRCFSCVDTIDQNMLELMKKAGCNHINYGIESASQKTLDLSGKGISVEQSIKAVKLTKRAGIEVSCSFMLGMMGDTEQSIEQTIKLSLKLDPDYAQFQVATPVLSTEFFNSCFPDGKNKNKLLKSELGRWSKRNIVNPEFTAEYLNAQLKKAYRLFYFRLGYMIKRLFAIKSIDQLLLCFSSAWDIFKTVLSRTNHRK